MYPMYASDTEWQQTTYQTLFFRLVVGALLAKLGWEIGSWEAKDPGLEQSQVREFESEE